MEYQAKLSQDCLRYGEGIQLFRQRGYNKGQGVPGGIAETRIIKFYGTFAVDDQCFQLKYVADQFVGDVFV